MARIAAPILILLLLSGCLKSEGVQDGALENAPLETAAATAPAQPSAPKLPPVPRMRPQGLGDAPARAGAGGDASDTPDKPAPVAAAVAGGRRAAAATPQDSLLSAGTSKPVNTAGAGSSSGEAPGDSIAPVGGTRSAASADPATETSIQEPRKIPGADTSSGRASAGASVPIGGISAAASADPAGEAPVQEPRKAAGADSPSGGAPGGVILPRGTGASTAASNRAANGSTPQPQTASSGVSFSGGASVGDLSQARNKDSGGESTTAPRTAEQPRQRVAAGADPGGARTAGDSGENETLLRGAPNLPPAGASSRSGNDVGGATGVVPAGAGGAAQASPAAEVPATPRAADTDFSLLGISGEPSAADLQPSGESRIAALTPRAEPDSPGGLDVESLFGGDVMRYCAAMGEMGRDIGEARGRGEKQKGAIADATARAARAYDLPLDKRLSFSGKVYGRLLYRLDDKHSPQVLGAYAEFACLTVRGDKKIVPADQDSERELNEGLRRCQSEAFTADDLRDCVFRRLTPVVDNRN